MNKETGDIIFALVLIAAIIAAFVWIAIKMRARGGSLMHTVYGATYEMQSLEKRAAIEQVLEQKVKKMEEQETDEPKDKVGENK